MTEPGQSLTLWCVTDGKPGHRSQLEGLQLALGDCLRTSVAWIDYREPVAAGLAPPDLILAAGHRTHWRALRLKWKYRAPLVVLMKPSLPRRLFDLCVVPEHDGIPASPRVITTVGMLNDIRPSTTSDPEHGLVMLGGPSRSHAWSDQHILQQLQALRRALPSVHWTVTTSRRTPDSLQQELGSLAGNGFEFVPFADTDRRWLRDRLRDCGTVWVSEDSASMVYEALSAGARVGVLAVSRRRDSRVSRGLDKLIERGMVTELAGVQAQGSMPVPEGPLREAQRVAQWMQQWLRRDGSSSIHENPPGTT